MVPKLIVALDFDEEAAALALIDKLNPTACALKVGSELFTRLGPDFVRRLVGMGFKIFLDLKFHDIPHTVARACTTAADLGVWMTNVHAIGGIKMMDAAVRALEPYGTGKPLLIAVTVLTSFTDAELLPIGVNTPLTQHAARLARLACDAGLDGVVSSAFEVSNIKSICGDRFIAVTPGIRQPLDAADDQARIVTPQDAFCAGSDYLVVGRPITRAADPAAAAQSFWSPYVC
jgi:orotidine-5'-phosphate decarboxylase